MSKRPAKPREGKPAVPSGRPSEDWLPFWDGEVTPLAEQQADEAAQLRARDDERRETGTRHSAEARAAKHADRNALIRRLRAEGKPTERISKHPAVAALNGDKPLSVSAINRVLAQK